VEYINKNEIKIESLPGRGLQKAIGKDSVFASDSMSVGYAIYSEEYGVMEPHAHAEETIIVTKSKNGWISWGDDASELTHKVELKEGMIMHIPQNLWHVFTYDKGGYVEIIFIYGTSDNIRPEEK